MFRRAGLYGVQGSFGSFLMPNMRRSTKPMNPFALSTTTFMPMVTHLSAGCAGGSPGCTFSHSPSGARAIRAALRRSAADDHDAERHHDDRSDKQCEPRGADARKDHAEAEGSGAHGALAAVRKAAVQAELRFTQNRHLRFPETRPEGLFQYIRKCRNVLHGTAPRAFRAFPMVLALTPSACRARRSRSRC